MTELQRAEQSDPPARVETPAQDPGETVVLSERAQNILAVGQYVKSNFLEPLLAVASAEIESRDRASVREIELARDELQREHQYKMRLASYSAALVALVITIGGLLLFYDKETGLTIICLVSVGGGTYAMGRKAPRQPPIS